MADPITTLLLPWVGEWITTTLASSLLSGVGQKLNPKDVEKALKLANKDCEELSSKLFFSCQPGGLQGSNKFLEVFFGDGVGLEELQKPLSHNQKPDVAVLVEAFQSRAKQHSEMQNCKFEYLQPWLSQFVESYFEQTSTFIRYRAKQREYLEALVNNCKDVKFIGIDVSAREEHRAAGLLDIFVVPNVSEEATKATFSPERFLLERPEQLTEQQAELWMEQRERHSLERGQSMSAHRMLSPTRRRVVLLGDPGTGKTTLMRYLAVMAAGDKRTEIGLTDDQERLPILIYMRDWAKHPERSLLDQVRDHVQNTLNVELPPGFLEHWTDGQALLLLDGLDEVAEDATRAALVEKINCFLSASTHADNWAVITSRPWGYRRDYFRTDAYPHFELELFDDKQIKEFIKYWYLNRCDNNEAQSQELVQDLQEALNRKDRLQNLVKNPLLLTMVALIHRYQDTLPKRRHKLYDRAVDTLLKSWDRKGKGETYGQFNHLDRDDDLRRVMSQLAYWIHTQYETTTTESGTLIEEEDLFTQLSRIIREEYPQVKPHQAREEAERFVTFIRDRTGLLNEYGRGRYAFVHKTFQEYLTAEAILSKADCEDDSELIYNDIRTHLHNPHWREVILLLISQLQGKKAAKAIEVILLQNSPYEQFLHRDLLFAGRCLTEDPEKLLTAAPHIVSGILKELVNLEKADVDRLGRSIKEETFEILSWLKETAFEAETLTYVKTSEKQIDQWRFLDLQWKLGEKDIALAHLLNLLKEESPVVRSRAATALGDLRNASPEVIQRLLNLLKEESPVVRSRAATALVNLGSASPEVIQGLLNLLKEKSPGVRSSAARALVNLGSASPEVIQGLLNLLKEKSPGVRSSAARALVNLGSASPEVIQGLLNLLKEEDSHVRSSATRALGNLGGASPEVIQGLLNLLKEEDSGVRSDAATALVNLRSASLEVVQGLLNLLKEKDSGVRSSAARALVNLGSASPEVIQGLLNLLKEKDSGVRSSAATALVNLRSASSEVIQGLLNLLKEKDSGVRSNAARTLGNLGSASPEVIQGLLNLLKEEDSHVRSSAATALGNLGSASPEVIQGLLNLLKEEDSHVRSSEEKTSENWEGASDEALQGLLDLIQGLEVSVRSRAARALGNLGSASPEVIQGLLNLLKEENSGVRSSAATVLGNLGSASPEVIQGLLNLLKEEDSHVRYSAATALGNLGKSNLEFQATLTTWIEQHSDLPTLGSAIDVLWQICA